eukprot:1652566-Rhodomonas_salina.5
MAQEARAKLTGKMRTKRKRTRTRTRTRARKQTRKRRVGRVTRVGRVAHSAEHRALDQVLETLTEGGVEEHAGAALAAIRAGDRRRGGRLEGGILPGRCARLVPERARGQY